MLGEHDDLVHKKKEYSAIVEMSGKCKKTKTTEYTGVLVPPGCTTKSEGSWLVEAAGEDTVWNSVRWVFCYASWSIHAHTLTAPFPSATPTPFSFHRTSNAVAQRPTSFSDSQGKTIFPSSQLAALTVELLSTLAT
ncbi:hypothetical protein PC128_g10714 [Phytophthora cactorum]|uniref:Uncharacterized protein n=2 Tax=Phytophthora cactorum TaxID=29920 RepID=A0A8T1CIX0_9STRA|nr:hypothetical protein PC117_g16029 [Phytophthora cactorum]KAG3192006.1 hypothetical protein PC128_g10714 [Phytophthora cactorum]